VPQFAAGAFSLMGYVQAGTTEQGCVWRPAQQAREDLAAVWKEAALKAAQARLEAFGRPDEATDEAK
jgi:hypothetical protein